jgi:hypothetical protein
MRIRMLLAIAAVLTSGIGAAQADDARWTRDPRTGCQMWDANPVPGETISWDGTCVNGFGEGHGTLTWYTGSDVLETDKADFIHGKLNGHGTLAFADGEYFDGRFRDHKPNGQGTLRTSDGEIFSGRWVEGCFRDKTRKMNYGVPPDACELSSGIARLKKLAFDTRP